jgi:hypothetical protein
VTSWNPNTVYYVPDDCDVLRLGNTIAMLHNDKNPSDERNWNPYVRHTDEVYRVFGMLATHAILFLTPKSKRLFHLAMDKVIEGVDAEYDLTFAK